MEALPFCGLLVLLQLFLVSGEVNTIHPDCPSACGDVAIPYPFGIGVNCSMSSFEIECNKGGMQGRNKPFIKTPDLNKVELININLTSGQARVYQNVSSICYNTSTGKTESDDSWMELGKTPYLFSYTLNKFTTVGCQTLAYIRGGNESDLSYDSGCLSACDGKDRISRSSLCSGLGCCQTSIPEGLTYFEVSFEYNKYNDTSIWEFNRCGYAFLVEEGWFKFDSKYITTEALLESNGSRVPMVLDWVIGNDGCEAARANSSSYVCLSEHSDCVNSTNGSGYRCACSKGYEGNPYLQQGCQDINECDHPEEYPCYGICINSEGNFTCKKRSTKIPLWLGFVIARHPLPTSLLRL